MCPTNLVQRNQTLWNPQKNWSLLQEVKMQIIFCFKWARWMHNFPQRNTFVSGSFCQESKFWGLQLLAVSDCPFQTAGSSAFLRRIWSKDRKRTELHSSIVFQNILYEFCLCFPDDHTCPPNLQTGLQKWINSYSQLTIHPEGASPPFPPTPSLSINSICQ